MAETAEDVQLEIRPTGWMRFWVTVVILLAAAISCVLIFLLTGGGRQFFERTTLLTTFLPDATGVGYGSEVRLSGLTIGRVQTAAMSGSLDPQRAVRVQMKVNTRFLRSIPSDSQTSVGADTLVGYKFISIDEGQSPIPVPESGELRSEPVRQASDRADLILALRKQLDRVNDLLIQIASPNTPVGQFVVGEDLYNQLLARITSLASSVQSLVSPNNALGNALFSDQLFRNAHARLVDADARLAAIQRGEGAAGKLFASDEQYNRLVEQAKRLRAVTSGRSPLLTDSAQYDRAVKLLRDTDAKIASIAQGNGKVARLLDDRALYDSLTKSLAHIEAFLRNFRETPGKYMRYQVRKKKQTRSVPVTAAPVPPP